MPNDDRNAQIEAFKAEIEAKIKALVSEFAEGSLSREQFHALYERYSARLAIATHALFSGNPDVVDIAQTGPPTIALREALMGKAIGLLIYHHASERVLETLGDFPLPLEQIKPILDDFTMRLLAHTLIEPHMESIGDDRWLLFVSGTYTTVVTLFAHEPAQQQIRELERLRHDFEIANKRELESDDIDPDRLGYPFYTLVRRKYGR